MNRAVITSKERLTEGGCNACGFKNCITYTLHFDDQLKEALDDLDLSSLVMTIALKHGWRQALIPVGIGEEQLVLKKADQTVELNENSQQITYQQGINRMMKAKTYPTTADLFASCNQVLTEIFEIEAYQLAVVD